MVMMKVVRIWIRKNKKVHTILWFLFFIHILVILMIQFNFQNIGISMAHPLSIAASRSWGLSSLMVSQHLKVVAIKDENSGSGGHSSLPPKCYVA